MMFNVRDTPLKSQCDVIVCQACLEKMCNIKKEYVIEKASAIVQV